MRLRPTAEYIRVIQAVLPAAADDAPGYGIVATQTAACLDLTDTERLAHRPNGYLACGLSKFANLHRSTLSAVLLRLRRAGEVCATGSGNKLRYWRPVQARYAGAVLNPTSEEIAKRAFEIYAGRGYAHGYHEQDWLQAERELRGE